MKSCPEYQQTMQALHSRRDALRSFARLAAAGIGSSLFPSFLSRAAFGAGPSNSNVVVFVFLRGGVDALSLMHPIADTLYASKRPTQAVTDYTLYVGQNENGTNYAFHPSLSRLYDIYTAGKLAIIPSTGSPDPTRSHFDAMRDLERGTPGVRTTTSGWLARYLANSAVQGDSPLRVVGFGGPLPDLLLGAPGFSAVAVDQVDDFGLNVADDQSVAMKAALDRLYGTANPTTLLGTQAKLAFDTITQLGDFDFGSYSTPVTYPTGSKFSLGLQQTAALIRANLGLQVACLDFDGWDTHANAGTNDGYLRDHIKEFGDSIAAFYDDMNRVTIGSGNLSNKILLVTVTEFGRQVAENASGGFDHGRASISFALGGQVLGGQYGSAGDLADLEDGGLKVVTDYRDVLGTVLNRWLDVPVGDLQQQIFPGLTLTPLGFLP